MFALAFLLLLLPSSVSTQSSESSEKIAVFEMHFEKNVLKIEGARAGLGLAPDYALQPSHWLEVRLLRDDETLLRSFKVRDPRFVLFDYVEGEGKNASLKGGKFFNESARFVLVVPLLPQASYANVFDENGTKLISINLRILSERSEAGGKEIVFKPSEGEGIGLWSVLPALVALVLVVLLASGIVALWKSRK